MITALLEPDDDRWRALLGEVRHDVYHLPGYGVVAAEHEGGVARALYADAGGARMLVPLVVHELPPALGAPAGWRDARSPYGYAGPLVAGDDVEAASACARAIVDAGRREGLVCAAVRAHPLLGPPLTALFPGAPVVRQGDSVVVRLSETPEQLAARWRPQLRADIRRLRRDGYRVEVRDASAIGVFAPLYRATMRRIGAAGIFHFPDHYFAGLGEALHEHLHVILALDAAGDVAGGALFTECGGIVQYLLAGTADRHARTAPAKLVLHHAIEWAHARGNAVLHLGGGRGGATDTLFAFKAAFSPDRAPLTACRLVFDPERYVALERQWCARATGTAPSVSAAAFPSYRQAVDAE